MNCMFSDDLVKDIKINFKWIGFIRFLTIT